MSNRRKLLQTLQVTAQPRAVLDATCDASALRCAASTGELYTRCLSPRESLSFHTFLRSSVSLLYTIIMYPLGVSTPEGIVSAAYSALKIYRAARSRHEKVAAAIHLLDSFDVALKKLEQTDSSNTTLRDAGSRAQIRTARAAWSELEKYLAPFKSQSDDHSTGPKTAIRSFRWALDALDGKVSDLQEQTSICLTAIMAGQISDMQYVRTISWVDVALTFGLQCYHVWSGNRNSWT